MKARINWPVVSSGAYQALAGMEKYARNCGLEPRLIELVKLRASQINKCAFCIDMHWKDLRAEGETEQRLYGLMAWEESPYYSDRERAALRWTESVTILTDGFVPDAIHDAVRGHFSEKELVDLTAVIIAINGWNRMCVSFRTEAGKYTPGQFRQT
jgi:AhpD family alkylhydroperoxidase